MAFMKYSIDNNDNFREFPYICILDIYHLIIYRAKKIAIHTSLLNENKVICL